MSLNKVTFHLLTDYDMYMMIEKEIRVGISQYIKRYIKTNNKLVEDIILIIISIICGTSDENNLYGHPLSDITLQEVQMDQKKIL